MTINLSPSTTGVADQITPLRAWLPALISIAVACMAFAIAFQREMVAAVKVWNESTTYNHCYLVLPLVAVLLWSRRAVIMTSQPASSVWPLLLLPGLTALWAAAALVDVMEAEQLVAMALFEVLLVALLGWRLFRALLAPLLFLFFLVPFGAFLVPVLQRFTADFAAAGLQALGIPVFADGFIIQIPEGTFEVAEACAGLRFLIASIVFGCFFATIVYHSRWRRSAFVALSIGAPVLANGLRALGLIVLAHLVGSAAAVETDHILYGWLFFTIVTLALIAIGLSFADRRPAAAEPLTVAIGSSCCVSPLRLGAIAATGLTVMMLGPTWVRVIEQASAAPIAPAQIAVVPGGPWVKAVDSADWRPVMQGANGKSFATYQDGASRVTEFVAGYNLPARGSPLTRTIHEVDDPKLWRPVASGRVSVSIGRGKPLVVNAETLARAHGYRTVWWFYVIDGHATASTLEAKLLQARAALSGGVHHGQFVAVSTASSEPSPANPILSNFLKALPLLPGRSNLR